MESGRRSLHKLFDVNAKDQSQHHQTRWLAFSGLVKAELVELLPTLSDPEIRKGFQEKCPSLSPEMFNTQIICAYAFLAEKRALIARELGGDTKNADRSEDYGKFRSEEVLSGETVREDSDAKWAPVQEAVFKHVHVLTESTQDEAAMLEFHDHGEEGYEYIFPGYRIEEVLEEAELLDANDGVLHGTTSYYIAVESPVNDLNVDGYPHSLFPHVLLYRDYEEDKRNNYLTVMVAPVYHDARVGDCLLAERYFKACRAAGTLEDFMLNAGRLSHLLVSLSWVEAGNGAIIEWLIAGLAAEKGIELGLFNFKDKITWDWKALVTPHRDTYATWYAEHAYLSIHAPAEIPQLGLGWFARHCSLM